MGVEHLAPVIPVHHEREAGANADHPELCGRCTSNLYGAGEPRAYA